MTFPTDREVSMGDGHKKARQAQNNVRRLVTHRERTLNSIMMLVDEANDDELTPEMREQIEQYLWDDDSPENDLARQYLVRAARESLSLSILLAVYHRTGPYRPGSLRAQEILHAAN